MKKRKAKPFKCAACGNKYDEADWKMFSAPGSTDDPDWNPKDGRCHGCFLGFLYEIYGGWMEPCFHVGKFWHTADGIVHEDGVDGVASDSVRDENIPF